MCTREYSSLSTPLGSVQRGPPGVKGERGQKGEPGVVPDDLSYLVSEAGGVKGQKGDPGMPVCQTQLIGPSYYNSMICFLQGPPGKSVRGPPGPPGTVVYEPGRSSKVSSIVGTDKTGKGCNIHIAGLRTRNARSTRTPWPVQL